MNPTIYHLAWHPMLGKTQPLMVEPLLMQAVTLESPHPLNQALRVEVLTQQALPLLLALVYRDYQQSPLHVPNLLLRLCQIMLLLPIHSPSHLTLSTRGRIQVTRQIGIGVRPARTYRAPAGQIIPSSSRREVRDP